MKSTCYTLVEKNIERYATEFDQIPAVRKETLNTLALFVKTKIKADEKAELIFCGVCAEPLLLQSETHIIRKESCDASDNSHRRGDHH